MRWRNGHGEGLILPVLAYHADIGVRRGRAWGPKPIVWRRVVVIGLTIGGAAIGGCSPVDPSHRPTQAPDVSASAAETNPAVAQGLSGSVRNESGEPVVGALVVPRSLQSAGPAIPELAILSNEAGRFAWPLQPGPYELTVTAEGYEPARGRGDVTQGKVTTIDFVLRRAR
jgi:hypothetical protein